MKGLLLKDLSYIRNSKMLVTICFIAVLFTFIEVNYVTNYLAIMAVSMLQTTFSYDEYKSGMKYILTLPVTRKQYVRSKYLLALLLGACSTCIGMTIQLIGTFVRSGFQADMSDLILMVVISVWLNLILTAIYIPLILKFGIERGRIIVICALLIMAVTIIISVMVFIDVLDILLAGLSGVGVFLAFAGLILAIFIGSYFASLHIMEKKEW